MEKGFKKYVVWQKADELAFQIYQKTRDFPQGRDVWDYNAIKDSGRFCSDKCCGRARATEQE